jgi:hypothetical protein
MFQIPQAAEARFALYFVVITNETRVRVWRERMP